MAHNPLVQFEIKKLIDINLFGIDISLTNSACFMIAAAILISTYFLSALQSKSILPTRMQASAELFFGLISSMLDQNIGPKGRQFMPLIFTIFIFILFCNLLGMLPYGFTVTSHISITFALAALIFIMVTSIGIIKHGLHFFSLFLPAGTPWWLAPLMIVIELFAYLARPISLSLRLAANMMAGHILLKVIVGFVVSGTLLMKFVPIPFIVVFIGFEIFVAILQAYIFSILSCVYLNDAINLH